MRTHTYTCNKGYAEEYKGREVSWQVPQTVEEAVSSGEFKDEATLVAYAVAQLNIRKGHAIQDATKALVGGEGPDKDSLANPHMTVADMEKVAASTKADGVRQRTGGGSQKVKAQALDTAKQRAAEIASRETDPAKIAMLRELGLLPAEDATATETTAPAKNGAKAKR